MPQYRKASFICQLILSGYVAFGAAVESSIDPVSSRLRGRVGCCEGPFNCESPQ